MRNEDGIKWLTASRLIELLIRLPGDSRVAPNAVGNLLVMSADGRRDVAYVDFWAAGAVEPMDTDPLSR